MNINTTASLALIRQHASTVEAVNDEQGRGFNVRCILHGTAHEFTVRVRLNAGFQARINVRIDGTAWITNDDVNAGVLEQLMELGMAEHELRSISNRNDLDHAKRTWNALAGIVE